MSEERIQKYGLQEVTIPAHIAIIMDGNGRWAKKRLWNRLRGHTEGEKRVDELVRFSREIGVKYLTLYAFSSENWSRPMEEVEGLMSLLAQSVQKRRDLLLDNGIRLKFIGDMSRVPDKIREDAFALSEETAARDYKMTLTVALGYGSRQEIVRAIRNICNTVEKGLLKVEDISEETVVNHLYTNGIPDPDLVIRTSGELRISNYLLWQIAYSELYFTDVLWPDFGKDHFVAAIKEYSKRERRFGKTTAQIKETE
jgi:undecaprenyl diphosphate synthase